MISISKVIDANKGYANSGSGISSRMSNKSGGMWDDVTKMFGVDFGDLIGLSKGMVFDKIDVPNGSAIPQSSVIGQLCDLASTAMTAQRGEMVEDMARFFKYFVSRHQQRRSLSKRGLPYEKSMLITLLCAKGIDPSERFLSLEELEQAHQTFSATISSFPAKVQNIFESFTA